MRNFKNYLIAFLAVTTLASGYFAWQQSRELAALRQSAQDEGDRAALRKRVWDAEKRARSLETELASTRQPQPAAAEGTVAGPAERIRRTGGPMMNLMENPEYQKLMALQQKGMLDGRYAALFKNLRLTPRQLEDFKRLLVERQSSMIDVMTAARAQGLDPRSDPDGFRQLINDTQGEIDQNIKTAIGDAAYDDYKNYEASLPYRNVVNQLEDRLSYSSTPLTETQSQQMLRIFSETTPQPSPGAAPAGVTRFAGTMLAGTPGGANVVTMLGGGTPISDEAVTRAQGVLAADQLAALQQLQEEQQAQAQMGRIMRDQLGRGSESGASTTTVIAVPAGR